MLLPLGMGLSGVPLGEGEREPPDREAGISGTHDHFGAGVEVFEPLGPAGPRLEPAVTCGLAVAVKNLRIDLDAAFGAEDLCDPGAGLIGENTGSLVDDNTQRDQIAAGFVL